MRWSANPSENIEQVHAVASARVANIDLSCICPSYMRAPPNWLQGRGYTPFCSIIEYVRGLCCHIFRQEVRFRNGHVVRFAFSCSNLSHPRLEGGCSRHLSHPFSLEGGWSLSTVESHQLGGHLSGTCALHLIGLIFDSLVPVQLL